MLFESLEVVEGLVGLVGAVRPIKSLFGFCLYTSSSAVKYQQNVLCGSKVCTLASTYLKILSATRIQVKAVTVEVQRRACR